MADPAEPEVPEGAAVFPLIPAELGINPLLLAALHEFGRGDGWAKQDLHFLKTFLADFGVGGEPKA